MRRLRASGIGGGDSQLLLRPETGQSIDSQEDDRSLAAVMRDIGRTLGGWLAVVVGVQLLLHAFRIV